MKRKVDHDKRVVFWEGDWPTCMAIPHLMKKQYPDYTYQLVSHQNFQTLDLPSE